MTTPIQNLDERPIQFGDIVQAAKERAGGWIESDAEFLALVREEYELLNRQTRALVAPPVQAAPELESEDDPWRAMAERMAAPERLTAERELVVDAGFYTASARATDRVQADVDRRRNREPGRARIVFDYVPRGMGPRKRWSLR